MVGFGGLEGLAIVAERVLRFKLAMMLANFRPLNAIRKLNNVKCQLN